MPKITIPIASGFYVDESLPLANLECTNWRPHIVDGPALNQETLRGTPGKVQATTTGETKQVNRGGHEAAGIPFFVNGNNLYRVNRTVVNNVASYNVVDLGVIPGTGRVWMADNGRQLMVLVPGGTTAASQAFIYDLNLGTFQEVTDPDFDANGQPQALVFIDGYFVLTTDEKKFIISALNDGLSYNALDFGTAEADPDDIVAPIVFNNQLFIGGSQTLEGFQNVGGGGFPFQRTGLFIPKGISAPFSIVNSSNSFMFIGAGQNESAAIWQFAGNNVQKVSSLAIDAILSRLEPEDEVFAWSYSERGAYFVGFTLPNNTLVYDTSNGRWHERKSRFERSDGEILTIRDRANSYVQAFDLVLVGDSIDGRIGILDTNIYNEYGGPIIRRVSTQPFQNNMESFVVPSIELTFESGAGNEGVVDPVIRMDRSLDGKTWTDERERKMGKIGEYKKRGIWRRNGRAARLEMFRWTLSDAVNPTIIQATAEIL